MTETAALAILAYTSSTVAYYNDYDYGSIYAREAYPMAAEYDEANFYAREAEPSFDYSLDGLHPRDAYLVGFEAGIYARDQPVNPNPGPPSPNNGKPPGGDTWNSPPPNAGKPIDSSGSHTPKDLPAKSAIPSSAYDKMGAGSGDGVGLPGNTGGVGGSGGNGSPNGLFGGKPNLNAAPHNGGPNGNPSNTKPDPNAAPRNGGPNGNPSNTKPDPNAAPHNGGPNGNPSNTKPDPSQQVRKILVYPLPSNILTSCRLLDNSTNNLKISLNSNKRNRACRNIPLRSKILTSRKSVVPWYIRCCYILIFCKAQWQKQLKQAQGQESGFRDDRADSRQDAAKYGQMASAAGKKAISYLSGPNGQGAPMAQGGIIPGPQGKPGAQGSSTQGGPGATNGGRPGAPDKSQGGPNAQGGPNQPSKQGGPGQGTQGGGQPFGGYGGPNPDKGGDMSLMKSQAPYGYDNVGQVGGPGGPVAYRRSVADWFYEYDW